jgi:hypothetical protein
MQTGFVMGELWALLDRKESLPAVISNWSFLSGHSRQFRGRSGLWRVPGLDAGRRSKKCVARWFHMAGRKRIVKSSSRKL